MKDDIHYRKYFLCLKKFNRSKLYTIILILYCVTNKLYPLLIITLKKRHIFFRKHEDNSIYKSERWGW